MEENNELINNPAVEYTDDNIRHLSDMEHVRTRPGMYIGKLGDGSHAEDGIYVLLKEIIDNSIDEFKMQAGKKIEIIIEENLRVSVRDYGRGIPQGKLIEAVSVLNTGGKYDSKAFKKSVGLNGVGVKAVNALMTAGDYAVLVSDGLLVDGAGWVAKQVELSAAAGDAPEKLAETLVQTARIRAQKTGRPDDITAAVLRLEKSG